MLKIYKNPLRTRELNLLREPSIYYIESKKKQINLLNKEIQEYLDKGLIRASKSPWSCAWFYVMKASEIEHYKKNSF